MEAFRISENSIVVCLFLTFSTVDCVQSWKVQVPPSCTSNVLPIFEDSSLTLAQNNISPAWIPYDVYDYKNKSWTFSSRLI